MWDENHYWIVSDSDSREFHYLSNILLNNFFKYQNVEPPKPNPNGGGCVCVCVCVFVYLLENCSVLAVCLWDLSHVL